ncbi:hypothetical protein cyc_03346 [Cyclospora cayetanensis]|uniref:F-box domain-containing protein n=1 Tax=Cyclospora cayetanensis TaxID=88456 RepID=A0A1D3D815_9EIME|nr:hypothetical protein cyc_03346 [Cyclospora cayetanensis]
MQRRRLQPDTEGRTASPAAVATQGAAAERAARASGRAERQALLRRGAAAAAFVKSDSKKTHASQKVRRIPSCPVDKLPEHLLARIFALSVGESTAEAEGIDSVCTRWRQVLNSRSYRILLPLRLSRVAREHHGQQLLRHRVGACSNGDSELAAAALQTAPLGATREAAAASAPSSGDAVRHTRLQSEETELYAQGVEGGLLLDSPVFGVGRAACNASCAWLLGALPYTSRLVMHLQRGDIDEGVLEALGCLLTRSAPYLTHLTLEDRRAAARLLDPPRSAVTARATRHAKQLPLHGEGSPGALRTAALSPEASATAQREEGSQCLKIEAIPPPLTAGEEQRILTWLARLPHQKILLLLLPRQKQRAHIQQRCLRVLSLRQEWQLRQPVCRTESNSRS